MVGVEASEEMQTKKNNCWSVVALQLARSSSPCGLSSRLSRPQTISICWTGYVCGVWWWCVCVWRVYEAQGAGLVEDVKK